MIDEKIVVDFVKEACKDFDESHDANHAITVYQNSVKIMNSFDIEYDPDILTFASLLHDVCDHKYPNSISTNDLHQFIKKHLSNNKAEIVIKLINNVSYSKEASGKREKFEYPFSLYLDAISDADRLEAIGMQGIKRCEQFTIANGGKVPENVIKHCYEKLLRLYPEKYIKTEYARRLAKPLHEEIIAYVDKMNQRQ